MKTKLIPFRIRRRVFVTVILMLIHYGLVYAQDVVTIQTANCSVTANTIQFDVTVTNNSASDVLDFNATVLRLTLAAGIIPPGAVQADIVFSYVGNSDFPNVWPQINLPKFNFILSNRLMSVSTGTEVYTIANCSVTTIPPGSTKRLGTFALKENKTNWVAGKPVGLAFAPTTALNAYINCAKPVKGFSLTKSNCTLITPCNLTTPADYHDQTIEK